MSTTAEGESTEVDSPVEEEPARQRATTIGGRVRRHFWLALSVAWLLFVAVRPVLSGRWWVMQWPDLLPPVIFVITPVALLVMAYLVARHRRLIAIGALASLGLALGFGSAGVNWSALTADPQAAPADAIEVMAWNTSFWHQAEDPQEFYDYITSYEADVYVLQEYIYHDWDKMWEVEIDDMAALKEAFDGYHVAQLGEFVTISKFPIVDTKPLWVDYQASDRYSHWKPYWQLKTLRTDVEISGEVVSIYNDHFQVPIDTNAGPTVVVGDSQDRFHNRRLQFEALADDLRNNDNPSVVSGDFNTSQIMGDMRDLDGLVTDAATYTDDLFPISWQSSGPLQLWRNDWTFTTSDIIVHQYELLDPDGRSDHAVQRAVLSLTPTGK